MPVYGCISTDGVVSWGRDASFSFAHMPPGYSSKESHSIQLNARGNFFFYLFLLWCQIDKHLKIYWKIKWIVQPWQTHIRKEFVLAPREI